MQKKIDLAYTFQVLGNIAVFAGVVFLAVEIQQSNRIARASIEIEVQNSFSATNSAVYTDLALAELLVKCRDVDPNLTEAEKEQAIAFVFQWVNQQLAIEAAFDNGLLEQATFFATKDDARLLVEVYPGLRQFVRFMLDGLPANSQKAIFQTYEQLLAEQES